MKRTLALLIAVLMIVAMLPMATLITAAQAAAPTASFEVYKPNGNFVAKYDTLAEADALLQDGYTLKVIGNYELAKAHVWGETRKGDGKSISFTIEGVNTGDDMVTVTYSGTGTAWTFGVNCAGDQITLKNIEMVTDGGAAAIAVSDGAVVSIESGKYVANGPAVVRTVAGSATALATLKIYGGEFLLNPSNVVALNDAVVTNGDSGHVYIYGGTFVNNNDATNNGVRSEYVLRQLNTAGDFQITSAVMMATPMQKGFYCPASGNAGDGVAIPVMAIPIVEGTTPKFEYEVQAGLTREMYYTAYGAGDAVLVPSVAAAPGVAISEDGTQLDLVFALPVSEDLVAAMKTWARGEAKQAGQTNLDNYVLELGIMIATEKAFLDANGVIADVQNTIVAKESIANIDGVFTASVENVAKADKEVRYVAIPFMKLSIDNVEGDVQYGEFHVAGGIGSMADAAAAALRDNSGVKDDVYTEDSIMAFAPNATDDTVPYMYSRFTTVQQQALVGYLAHQHEFDYQGACVDEECDVVITAALAEGTEKLFYAANGSVNFFAITVRNGVSYSVGFSKDVVNYQVYDADGNPCALVNGVFVAQFDDEEVDEMTYYVRVDGKKTGATEIAYSHIHSFENGVIDGTCDVSGCGNVAVNIEVEKDIYPVVVKGNTYIFRVALKENASYTLRVTNGTFKVYDADGAELFVYNNVLNCEADGVYYIEMEATYTGKGAVQIVHNHNYDHTGECDYCHNKLGVALNNVYQLSDETRVIAGDQLFFSIRLQAGKDELTGNPVGRQYKIVTNRYIGTFELYNELGERQQLSGSSFVCVEDGMYYLKVNVLTKTTAQVGFEAEHGVECSYNNKGECEFLHAAHDLDGNGDLVMQTISCGKNGGIRIEDSAKENKVTIKAGAKSYFFLNYAAKGVTYKITIKGDVSYTFYAEDGVTPVMLEADSEGVITYKNDQADTVLYLVMTNTSEERAASASVSLTHVHDINYRGRCNVMITTSGKAPTACTERQLENIKADTAVTVTYEENAVYHYAVSLKKDVMYEVKFENAAGTVQVFSAAGEELFLDDETQTYIPQVAGTYYVVVTASADSEGTQEVPATMLVGVYTAPVEPEPVEPEPVEPEPVQ